MSSFNNGYSFRGTMQHLSMPVFITFKILSLRDLRCCQRIFAHAPVCVCEKNWSFDSGSEFFLYYRDSMPQKQRVIKILKISVSKHAINKFI